MLNNIFFYGQKIILKVAKQPMNIYPGRSIYRIAKYNVKNMIVFFARRGPSYKLLQPTRQLKSTGKHKSVLIIGSGPSLDLYKPEDLKSKFNDCIAINDFHLSALSNEITPTFYLLSDPNCINPVSEQDIHKKEKLIQYLDNKKIPLIVSHFYRKQISREYNKVIYFDDRESHFGLGGISPLRPRNYVSMTLYKALAMAIFIDYEKIYVIGMDNNDFKSYFGDTENRIWINEKSHYSKYFSSETKQSRVIDTPNDLEGQLYYFALVFGDLQKFQKPNIFNLDPSSLIQKFIKLHL